MEPGRTHDEVNRENEDRTQRQSFPIGSMGSKVGENSQSRELRPLAMTPVQEIRSSRFQLFDEQPTVHQPQPGEQF